MTIQLTVIHIVFWKTDLPEETLHYVYTKFRLWKIVGPVKC